MLKKIFISLILIIFALNSNSIGLENKILVKIENQVITTLDVDGEYKYLVALNPVIKNYKKEDIIKISKKSIISERIKKILILLTKFLILHFLQIWIFQAWGMFILILK